MLPRIEGLLQRLLRRVAEGHTFLLTCGGLALLGTVAALYPVTAVVVPAVLLVPQRWKGVSVANALGSALGASLLVIVAHHMGWSYLYEHYPQLATHADWLRVISWVEHYGLAALFVVSLSPLPQTPALLVLGVSRQEYLGVFFAILAGKLIKYGAFAYVAKRFPERFGIGSAQNGGTQ